MATTESRFGEETPKAVGILIAGLVCTVAGLWLFRQQGYALILEIAYVLLVFLVFAIIYDRFVIR